MKRKLLTACLAATVIFNACGNNDTDNSIEFKSHSVTPAFLKLKSGFENVEVYPLISSEDVLEQTPNFVFGSMTDGAGLLKDEDGYTLINNIEADYSVARIKLDKNLKPVSGEYILNAVATASTAQCSGTLVTPEEHGFGPLYLSGGEWGGSSKGVFAIDPYKNAADRANPTMLTALGEWSTENAVPIGKDAYSDKTVVFIGDDQSANDVPSGHLGVYVGNRGDLYGGKLYSIKVTDAGINYEMDMVEGQSYTVNFVELQERNVDLIDAEAKNKGIMAFSRVEDIDWRRGSAANQREVYFVATGRKRDALQGKGTFYGRIYKLVLNENDPTAPATITCILDGDNLAGKAKQFHSPDNILVTENYAYIQEDPNGYFDTPEKTHYAYVYQYDLRSGELKVVMEADQETAAQAGIGTTTNTWEFTGMIDISDVIGEANTYILGVQNHGWEKADGTPFTDPTAVPENIESSRAEGSQLFIVRGLNR